tara:strand:- start:369 stop:635 length:267 start_codon:yes stop_codon:yes gene_type:complete
MPDDKLKIQKEIIEHIKLGSPALQELKKIPLDKSLVELGYLDSFGVIDVVTFMEKRWNIKIFDDDITREKMGSLNKMTTLVIQKLKSN